MLPPQLNKYKNKDHFFFQPDDGLSKVCNAPTDKSGVYLVYALKNGKIELIYIGRSGKRLADGTIQNRKAGLGGMKDRLVNGHHFGKIARKYAWPIQMMAEGIEALDIYWWVTYDENHKDCPCDVELELLDYYNAVNGSLPKWNKSLRSK